MLTKEYEDYRSPEAPPEVPSAYASDGQVVLHFEEDGQTTIRKMTAEWADALSEWLCEAVYQANPTPTNRQFSLKEDFGLGVDCVGGAITMTRDRRLHSIQLGHDDIDMMIGELRAAKRRSLELRGDPVRDKYPYIRQSLQDEFEPAVVCTEKHPEGLELDDSLLDPKLAESLEKFIAETNKNEATLKARQEAVPVVT